MPMKIVQTDLNVSALKDQNLKYLKRDINIGQKIFFKKLRGKKDNQSYDAIIISTPPVSI